MGQPAGTPFRRTLRGRGIQQKLRAVQIGAEFMIVWVGAILVAPTDKLLGRFVQYWHNTAWIWLIIAVVAWVVTLPFRRGDRAPMDATGAILDEFRDALFGGVEDDDANHRITLFKRERRWLMFLSDTSGKRHWRPGCRWLVPVARSGHGTGNTRIRFRCPDDTNQAEGVAGRAWARQTAFSVANLPDLADVNCSNDDRERYAGMTNVSERWVTARWVTDPRRRRARSLMGFRVDDARSEPWGVLVIDSHLPTFNTQLAQNEFGAYAPVLAQLVRGI